VRTWLAATDEGDQGCNSSPAARHIPKTT
jgi:hypothetical protein